MEKSCYPGRELTLYLDKIGCRCDEVKGKLITETFRETKSWSDMMTPLHQCEFMKMMVQLSKAKKEVEIGTFTGLASLCFAEALPEVGMLYTLETNKEWINIAQKYWKMAKVDQRITLKTEPINESLEWILSKHTNCIDFVFINADKINIDSYYETSLNLIKNGGLIFIDNVLWDTRVIYEAEEGDLQTKAIQELNLKIKNDSRVDYLMLPISDGLTIVRKKQKEIPKPLEDAFNLSSVFASYDDY